MKKLSFFLMAMLFSVMSFAQEAIYTLDGTITGGSNGYADASSLTQGNIAWSVTGNTTMSPWRIGGKTITNQDRAVYSKNPLAYNIDKIELTHGTANSITVNSLKLIISDAANGAGETIDVTFKASATTTIDLPEGDYSNKYFKFLYNVTVSESKNKFVEFKSAKFYAALAEDAVKAPVITGAEDFVSETEVTIEAEDDVTVYYTLDGTEPTTASTVYAAPFTVKKTTTVKAVAYRGETASFVTSATFTQATRVTAAEAAQLAMKVASNNALTSVTYVIDAYVTSVIDQTLSSGQQRFWVADTKDGGQVLQSYYCNVPQVLKVGDYIQMFGKLTKYNTSPQMKNGDVTILPEPVVSYVVTVSANPAEAGTVAGAGEYEEGKEATLTATAAEGYEFVNWTVDGAEVSTENPYTFVVTANVALVANFKAVVIEEPLPEGVPTNAELWEAFKPYYNTYYGLTRDLSHPVANVSTFANAKMQEIMTDAASEYKWLGDYVLGVAAGQGVNLPTDMAAANEGAWRWAVHAFFNATTGANGAAGTDFTEAGKPQVWGPYYLAAQKPAAGPVEIVGVVKRALQLGETTIILTHEANGTPHIYTVAGKTIAEVSQEGVVAKDTANAGDYLTISDIALTEDGKLVACNYVRNQFEASYIESGYKRGTLHLYVWHDIKGAASIWFESMFTGNSTRGDCGYTMAVNGTVANANILVSAVHNSHRGVRMSHYTVIDGAYVEPNYANQTFNNHLFYVGAKFKGASAGEDAATFNEATHGVNFQLNASPLAESNWVIDSEGLMPTEFGVAAKQDPSIVGAVAETLVSKALVGAYYVTVGEKKVMVAPYADAEGKLAGVKLLDITAGFANATPLATKESLDLTAPVAATGVATTAVVESNGTLTINLIADATIHTMTATIQESPSTNLENNNVQNDIIKFYQNGQIYIMINGAVYNVMGQMVK